MYQIKDLDPEKLEKAQVKNQAKILKIIQLKFSPVQAFEVIKRDTENFSLKDSEALEADQLFAEFLKREGIELPKKELSKKSQIQVRERERARKLKLLALKLKLAA